MGIIHQFAPSVLAPERFAPSVRFYLFPELLRFVVLLPESFRGGCSFGAILNTYSLSHKRSFSITFVKKSILNYKEIHEDLFRI